MSKGVLTKWFPRPKSYGFIKPPGHTEIFAIARDFVDQSARPKVGTEVEYEVGKFPDGRPRALRVKVISKP